MRVESVKRAMAPIESVTITFMAEEALMLRKFFGGISGSPEGTDLTFMVIPDAHALIRSQPAGGRVMRRDMYRRWRVLMYRRLACWRLGIVARYIEVRIGR